MTGTFAIPNRVFEDKYFEEDRPLSRREAVAWLAKHVRWTDNCVLRRGQGSWSERYLAEAWGWARTKVQRFLKKLESMNLIRLESGLGRGPVEKVITYLFSMSFRAEEAEDGPAPGQDRASTGPKTNSGKAGNEDFYDGSFPGDEELRGAELSEAQPAEPAPSPKTAAPPPRKPRAKLDLDGWRPKEATIAQMRKETGATESIVEWELSKMLDWCRTTTKPVKDLEARFRNWMRSWKDGQDKNRRPTYHEQKKAEYAI